MSGRLWKLLLVACGTMCVALGVVGIFLPIMPTTVFLLMAAACYARSSERFYHRLLNQRYLGSYIRNHREGRGMKRRDKAVTLVLLWIGMGATIILSVDAMWGRFVLLAIATAVTVHVAKIPAFRPAAAQDPDRASSVP